MAGSRRHTAGRCPAERHGTTPITGTCPIVAASGFWKYSPRSARTPAGPTCRRRSTAPRQQFDRGSQRAAQPGRRQFGQEQGNAEADRHGDDQRDDRGHDGAVDGHQRAMNIRGGSHSAAQKAQSERLDRRRGADRQRDDDAAQQQQRHDGCCPGQAAEQGSPARRGARRGGRTRSPCCRVETVNSLGSRPGAPGRLVRARASREVRRRSTDRDPLIGCTAPCPSRP